MSSPLNKALYSLLFDKAYREAFLSDRLRDSSLSQGDLAALQSIDRAELTSASETICARILNGDFDLGGGLRKVYPGVFRALGEMNLSEREVGYRLLASPEFRRYKELPFNGEGLCIEEAFYLFLRRQRSFREASESNVLLLTHEFLGAILAILTVNEHPYFVIASKLIRFNGFIRYATYRYPDAIVRALVDIPPAVPAGDTVGFLYASSIHRRFIKGAVDDLTLACIRLGSWQAIRRRARSLGRDFGADVGLLANVAEKLVDLGLIAGTA